MPDSLNYLMLTLIWAGPVILLEWLLGLDILIKRWKVWIPGSLLPTLYLMVAEAFATRTRGVNPTQSLGVLIPVLNIPLENTLLNLLANLLVVQTLLLSIYFPLVWKRIRRVASLVRRTTPPPGV